MVSIKWRFALFVSIVIIVIVPVILLSYAGLDILIEINLINCFIISIPYWILFLEIFYSRRNSEVPYNPKKNYPGATIIVSAYLPNEKDIIYQTIQYLLNNINFPGDWEVILAYNTPPDLDVENKLKKLEYLNERFKMLRVDESLNKATDLNLAIKYANGDVILLIDADSRPHPDCLIKACFWFERGYDFVQGVNLIANPRDTWLSRLISIEISEKYLISYKARFASTGVTYFTGSNGYWRRKVLEDIFFSPSAQVEDIDASIRAMLTGHKLAFDPSIIAFELAPIYFSDWWKQRSRWAKGWAELTKWHQKATLSSSAISLPQKVYWTYFFMWRRLFYPIILCLTPVIIIYSFLRGMIYPVIEIYMGLFFLVVISALSQGLKIIIKRNTSCLEKKINNLDIIFYAILFPIYDIFRNLTIILSLYIFISSKIETWERTPRRFKTFHKESEGSNDYKKFRG